MQLNLGAKIRELRHRDGRTQEAVAEALGVTAQAVSRCESGGSYPDMELMPAIANYFGVTIDLLFGYHSDREAKIDAIIARVAAYDICHNGDDGWVDECLAILRDGLAEFPGQERLLITLAETLWEAGWRRHREWVGYDQDGFIQYSFDRQKKNSYWTEVEKICTRLTRDTKDNSIFTRAVMILVPLYRNFGEYEKAIHFAAKMPKLTGCREYLLTEAVDGKRNAKYIGEFLLRAAKEFSEQMIFGLISNLAHFADGMPIRQVEGCIGLFDLFCEDGNLGPYHDFVSKLYLYLSRLQWEGGYGNEAFASLNEALAHARAYDSLADGEEHAFTAPLLSEVTYRIPSGKITPQLPADWPFWCNPDYSAVEKAIKADPRWAEWAARTQD